MKNAETSGISKSLIVFLQTVIVLTGSTVLAFMLIMPHFEGRNIHATVYQIYFNDPFLAYVYVASVPFFVALAQAFSLFGRIGRNEVFSQASINSLKKIKYCAFITATTVIAAVVYLRIDIMNGNDESPGIMMLGNAAALALITAGIAAALFQKMLQSAIVMKSENDLTL